jgi:S1-C subfamily serine protease
MMAGIFMFRYCPTLRVGLPLLLLFCVPASAKGHGQTQNSTREGLSPQEVFRRVSPSVFVVESLNSEGDVLASGSGVAVNLPIKGKRSGSDAAPDVLVVTNKHVIYGAVAYRIWKGKKVWKANLVRLDQARDLCALQPEIGWSAKPVTVRVSPNIRVGEVVYAIGAPEGLELTLSEGLVSGLRDVDNMHVIQTTAAISHGSSGGGLFDSEGRLIGITAFFLEEGQNLNFALPGEWILGLGDEAAAHFPATASGSQLEEAKKWSDKGASAFDKSKYQEAIGAYEEAVRLDPNDAKLWYRLGEAQQALQEDGGALKSFQESMRLKDDDPLTLGKMVLSCIKLRKYDEAIDAANKILLLNSDNTSGWLALTAAYNAAGLYKEAIDSAQMLVVLDPESARAWMELGTTQLKANQTDEAIASLQQAVGLDPKFRDALYLLGLGYAKQGDQSKVREIADALQRLDPRLSEKLLQATTRR